MWCRSRSGDATRHHALMARAARGHRHPRSEWLAAFIGASLLTVVTACTTGDGEGPRYIGRVVSATPTEVCVGPSSSSRDVTCGGVPPGVKEVPQVGQCVGLFPGSFHSGKVAGWSAASLRLHYDDKVCAGATR